MKESYLKALAVFVVLTVFVFGVLNFINQMHHADHKDLWLDEVYGLKNTIQGNSYGGLLFKAAKRTESNAAPLDYMCVKVFDNIKRSVNSFGVSDKVYYRLWPNFAMIACGLVIVCLFAWEIVICPSSNPIRTLQMMFLILLPLLYLYRPAAYHYAAEERPYALWFALWFISVGLCSLSRINKLTLSIVLSLLAMTMVGSIFQILSLGAAYFVVGCMQNGWKQAVKDTLQVILIPLFLVIFYAYPADYGHRTDEPWPLAWHRFMTLWGHEAIIIPMLLFSIVSLYLSKRTQSMMTGPLAALIVFLMGPLIFYTTLKRGYFFTERQYIYYDAHRAIFWLSLINLLPYYLEKIKDHKKQLLAMVLIFVLWLPYVFPKKTLYYIGLVTRQTIIY